MSNFIKLLLVWIALAGLPVQGFAAVTMSCCKHGGAAVALESHEHPGDAHSGHDHSTAAGQPCNDCTPCHLCSAFALPTPGIVLPQDAAPVFVAHPALPTEGFLAEPPRRPPLA